jgi:hypothetical protein
VGIRAKQRILQNIRPSQKERKISSLSYWLSTAAAVLLLAGGIYWFGLSGDRKASIEELAGMAPGKEHAIIILPSGEAVNLDSIPLSQSIQVGNTIISKNEWGGISYENTMADKNPIYSLQTPKSSVAEIVLSDGTKVLLNAESKLHYPASFTEGDRIVQLEGEGYFQVSKTVGNSRFIVRTADQEITVLGTKFNVKAYGRGSISWTTLEEGSVRVAIGNKGEAVMLTPGHQAVHRADGIQVEKANLESVLGWTKGVFYFDGTNTTYALQQIEQWYDIDITYKGDKDAGQYSGKIPRNLSLDKLIDLLTYADFTVEPRINKENRINLIIN